MVGPWRRGYETRRGVSPFPVPALDFATGSREEVHYDIRIKS